MRDLHVGVVGAGGAAQVVHLPILKRLPDVELVALIDADRQKARTIGERFEVPFVGGELTELAQVERLDAVLVCTPNDTHEENVIAALALGMHVMCERPISVTSESAARMVAAAERADRHLMVAMNQRFRYDARAVKQFVASGELGEVFFVRSVFLNRRHRRPKRGWRRERARAGGGALMDLGVQALDLALWLLDFPRVETVTARFHGKSGEVEDSAVVLLALEGGATVSVEATWELQEERDRHTLYALGTRGSASLSPFRVRKQLETGLTDVTPPLDTSRESPYTASYRQEWAEFLRLVRGEKPGDVGKVEAEQVELMRVVEACYRSASAAGEIVP
ncbi:MAG: Gfo/Idh/MocA family protein [Gemmatimonadota bacterium]